MCDRWLPDPPAHGGLAAEWPALAPLAPLPEAVAALVRARRGRALLPGPPASWVVELEAHDVLVRVVSAERAARIVRGDRIARHAAALDVAVSTLRPGWPQAISPASSVTAHEYVAGRFARAEVADLRALGAALRGLHEALRALPSADRVRSGAEARWAMLSARAARLAAGEEAGPWPERVTRLVRQWGATLDVDDADAQPLHGDINAGNVIFPPQGAPVLIDFEDAPTTWLSPAADLAAAVERFAMRSQQSRHVEQLVAALVAGYDKDLAEGTMTRHLARRGVQALCVLAEAEAAGARPAAEEWDKILVLLEDVERRHDLVAQADGIASGRIRPRPAQP